MGLKSLKAFAFCVAVTSLMLPYAIAQGPPESLRTWTSRQGSEVEAALVGIEHGQVKLRLKDGKEMSFAVDQLAEDDMKHAMDRSGWGRVWKDGTGQHQTIADLVSADDHAAKLERTDGTTISVPLTALSAADRGFIEQRLARDAAVAALKKLGARVELNKNFAHFVENAVPPSVPHPVQIGSHAPLPGPPFVAVYLDRGTDAAVPHLEQLLPDLRVLHLQDARVTDDGLSRIGQLKSLTTLYFLSADLTDAGVVHLANLRGLTRLKIHATRVTDDGLEHLRGLSNLQSLELSITRLTDKGLAHFAGMTNLEVLRIYDSPFTGAGLQQLGNLHRLRELGIVRAKIVDAELRHLSLFKNLIHLGVSDCSQITDAGLPHLYPLSELQRLNLSSSRITDSGLKALAGMTKLKVLVLGVDQMTNAGVEHLKELTSLELLVLSGEGVTDAGLEHLSKLKRLQKLVLFRVSVDGSGLSHLGGLTELRELHFNQTKVTNAQSKSLKATLPECHIWVIPPAAPWN